MTLTIPDTPDAYRQTAADLRQRADILEAEQNTDRTTRILNAVASHYGIPVETITACPPSGRRFIPRMVAIYLIRRHTTITYHAMVPLFNYSTKSMGGPQYIFATVDNILRRLAGGKSWPNSFAAIPAIEAAAGLSPRLRVSA